MIKKNPLNCFKAYDIRGRVGEEINEDIAYRIGRASVQALSAKSVVIGFDARATSPELSASLVAGICDSGADVFELGLSGTEEMYFAVSAFHADAGIVVTASHNPIDYNGMKIVKSSSSPISEQEFSQIKFLTKKNDFFKPKALGSIFDIKEKARDAYIEKLLNFVDLDCLKPLRIVINSGNGTAGPVVDALHYAIKKTGVQAEFCTINHLPDPTFPSGIPNPLLKENRFSTTNAIKTEQADFGVAFDGDFDRCFIFDNFGNFIPGEYLVGILAEFFLAKQGPEKIVHDPRATWNIEAVIKKKGGQAIVSKTGHAFVKSAMRENKAIYGGELSAHHYFRDFSYCDSGMIPWLIIWEILSNKNIFLSDLIEERRRLFPSSGELNFTVTDAPKCLARVEEFFSNSAKNIDYLDGLSVSFEMWRFNLRKSNTEPLVRLNVETMGDEQLLEQRTKELINLINQV